MAEELDHTAHRVAEQDREGESAVQARFGRRLRPREVRVAHDVRDPVRLGIGPDPAREADAAREGPAPGQLLERRRVDSGRAPEVDAADRLSLPVDLPHSAEIPGEARTD